MNLLRTRALLSTLTCGLVLILSPHASGSLIFTEDFENPVVTADDSTGYTNGTIPSGWVGATQGFGASRRGIALESAPVFTDPVGQQAFAFRYTNSGLTSAEGEIGTLTLGSTYTVSFDIATDSGATPFTAQLIAFAAGAARNDVRNTPAGSTVLAALSGNASSSIIGDRRTFVFIPDAVDDAADVGKDLGIRFRGATNSAMIDNVAVDVVGLVPEPGSLALVSLGVVLLCGGRRTRR